MPVFIYVPLFTVAECQNRPKPPDAPIYMHGVDNGIIERV